MIKSDVLISVRHVQELQKPTYNHTNKTNQKKNKTKKKKTQTILQGVYLL